VEFEGDVRLAGRPGEDPVAAELLTPRLALDTVTEVAETKSPVELAFGAHRMRALGMRADLKTGTLRLDASVNGTFTP
jgi:LPS export ABC transporter protein LptC